MQEIYEKPNIFALLVHSLCPGIYGHEMIKAGLLLSLFGGNAKHKGLRDHIHVLIVGDPGLGKSQMLQACSRVSAKGEYKLIFKNTYLKIFFYFKVCMSVAIQVHLQD